MTDRIADWFLRHGATAGRVLGVLGILCAIAALSVCTSGCSGASYRAHAQAITVTSGGLAVAGTVADTARDAALDAVEAEHPAHGAERTAALEAEALRMAHLAGTTDADLVAMLAPVAARVLLLYDQIAALLEALDVDGVPALPAVVRGLVTTIGGVR